MGIVYKVARHTNTSQFIDESLHLNDLAIRETEEKLCVICTGIRNWFQLFL